MEPQYLQEYPLEPPPLLGGCHTQILRQGIFSPSAQAQPRRSRSRDAVQHERSSIEAQWIHLSGWIIPNGKSHPDRQDGNSPLLTHSSRRPPVLAQAQTETTLRAELHVLQTPGAASELLRQPLRPSDPQRRRPLLRLLLMRRRQRLSARMDSWQRQHLQRRQNLWRKQSKPLGQKLRSRMASVPQSRRLQALFWRGA